MRSTTAWPTNWCVSVSEVSTRLAAFSRRSISPTSKRCRLRVSGRPPARCLPRRPADSRQAEAGGADLLLLCTNTMHKVADQVQDAVRIPLLHIGDVAAKAVTEAGLRTVGLLGTAFTMVQDFYVDRLAAHGLTVLVPDAADRADVHRIIYDELCLGVVLDESRQLYRDVIERLVQAGAQGIVLGCTEIELLVTKKDSSVPVFPTTLLHVQAAVDASLADLES